MLFIAERQHGTFYVSDYALRFDAARNFGPVQQHSGSRPLLSSRNLTPTFIEEISLQTTLPFTQLFEATIALRPEVSLRTCTS